MDNKGIIGVIKFNFAYITHLQKSEEFIFNEKNDDNIEYVGIRINLKNCGYIDEKFIMVDEGKLYKYCKEFLFEFKYYIYNKENYSRYMNNPRSWIHSITINKDCSVYIMGDCDIDLVKNKETISLGEIMIKELLE